MPNRDSRHNVWSGLHTRLGAEVVHRRQIVEGVVIWDMLCGTPARPRIAAPPLLGPGLDSVGDPAGKQPRKENSA